MKSIETAMKDPKFCKLFAEYAEEIGNPENRQVVSTATTSLSIPLCLSPSLREPTGSLHPCD